MTAKEEDILTNQNYIKNGTVIDKLLKSLIVTTINYDDLLIGDKNAILVAARILGYGSDYSFKMINPSTGTDEIVTVDLTEANDKELDEELINEGKNDFLFTLPHSKINVTFNLLTQSDEKKIEQELKGLRKINKNTSSELTTRMKHLLTSVNGDYEKSTIREFVDTALLARDARSLREHVASVMPDIDLEFDIEFDNGHIEEGISIPIGVGFFWPDAGV
jgi:ribosomal protein S20